MYIDDFSLPKRSGVPKQPRPPGRRGRELEKEEEEEGEKGEEEEEGENEEEEELGEQTQPRPEKREEGTHHGNYLIFLSLTAHSSWGHL